MRAMFLIALLLPALPDRPNPTPQAAPKTFHEQILGDWQVANMVVAGGDAVPAKDEVRIVRITPKTVEVFVNGTPEPDAGGDYTIDTTKSPIHFNLVPRNEPQSKVEAIMKLDADQLVLAMAFRGPRPTDFSTSTKELLLVTYLKRANR